MPKEISSSSSPVHNEEYSDALAIINHQDSELGFVARHDNEYESDEEYDIVTASADVVTSTRTTVKFQRTIC